MRPVTAVFGVRWDGRGRAVVLAVGVLLALLAAVLVAAGASSSNRPLTVIVMGDGSRQAVQKAGGSVEHTVALIDGIVARVPAGSLASLRSAPGVRGVTADHAFTLSSGSTSAAPDTVPVEQDDNPSDSSDPILADEPLPAPVDNAPADALTVSEARLAIRADQLPAAAGERVDVALVDSGITPLGPLSDRVVDGADFSSDARDADLRFLDAFGHGTHLAGIVAGVAPESRLVNVKVADAEGQTSLVQLLLGIDWATRHRADGDRNIKVLTLAVGSDDLNGYVNEPLAYAVERAWRYGVTVVAAAGNQGTATSGLDLPAADPFILAVAGIDAKGTADTADDVVADWSSRGNGQRDPDVAAPGGSVLSVRVPSSFLDEQFPGARVGEDRFRGSGTSQAAAVAAAAAALLSESHPDWTPNQVKAALRGTARPLGAGARAEGQGAIDVAGANAAEPADAVQPFVPAALPSMRDLYRRLAVDRRRGDDTDLAGRRWSGRRWSGVKWSGVKWSGVKW